MPAAESAAAAGRRSGAPRPTAARLHGWGGGPGVRAEVVAVDAVEQLQAVLAASRRPLICRGMGRSYGDVAQLEGGLVIDLRGSRWSSLDADRGTVRAAAGATLGQLLARLEPAGWLLPVVPGTQHVTVGGAIACDVHGKNHAAAGSFGRHVRALELVTADGEARRLQRGDGDDLLDATIGGLGLTGVVTWAEIDLVRAPASAELVVDVDRVGDLDGALAALDAPGGGPHRVAWLDLLGRRPARGVVTRAAVVGADPAVGGERRGRGVTVAPRARVPAWWPAGALAPATVRAYNELRFRAAPRRARERREAFGAHMFPLDALDAWPRLYGPAGLVQYQCVVPRGREDAVASLLARLRSSAVPCYLAVLKDLGDASPAPLSFPLRGWTLALDLPASAPGLTELLRRLDTVVVEAQGRVYFAKDGRVDAATVAAMYPRLADWRAVRDRVDPEHRWQSDLAQRAGLVCG